MTYYKTKDSDTIHKDRKCSYIKNIPDGKIKTCSHRSGEKCDRCSKGRG